MSLDALPGWARSLLDDERVARFAFLDDKEHPRVLPVTFAVSGDAVWSAIDDKPKRTAEPARVRWLRRRPAAALLVDVYEDDWSRLAWVQLLGRVEVIGIEDGPGAAPAGDGAPAAGSRHALAALAAKYEPYAERTPPGPLLRLTVERTLHWRAAG